MSKMIFKNREMIFKHFYSFNKLIQIIKIKKLKIWIERGGDKILDS